MHYVSNQRSYGSLFIRFTLDLYAPFMGIMFSGLCVCSSIRLSRFRLKFLVKVVFDEVEVTCSLWYDLSTLDAKLKFLPHFPGPLNMENDSASGASVYYGHSLVKIYYACVSKWINFGTKSRREAKDTKRVFTLKSKTKLTMWLRSEVNSLKIVIINTCLFNKWTIYIKDHIVFIEKYKLIFH